MDALTQRQYDGQQCSDLQLCQPHPLEEALVAEHVLSGQMYPRTCKTSLQQRLTEATGTELYAQ